MIEYWEGWQRKRYAIHFVCTYSGYHWVRTISHKHEAWSAVMEFLTFIKNQTQLQPQILSIDGFREIIDWLEKYCDEKGIALNVTVPNTSEQNGRAERAGKTLNAQARATCIDAGIPEMLWPFTVESSAYVNNLLPSSVNPDNKSPHERLMEWFGAPERSVKPFI